MPTLRQALDKISELRSRVAMIEMLTLHVSSNYIDDDGGEAEMSVTREDSGLVPQKHMKDFMSWLEVEAEQATDEIDVWESMSIETEEESAPPKRKRKTRARNTKADD